MRRAYWAVFLAALFVLAGCQKQAQPKALQVVASTNFYGEVAQAVLGSHGHVTSVITDPAVDPHDYEPTTAVGKKVAKAQVVVANGIGYDAWMTKLVKANNGQATTVTAAQVVGAKPGDNEHLWYQPQTMAKLATRLATVYGRKDPAHQKAYRQNAKRYIRSLRPLQQQLAALRAQADGQAVGISEPVFTYALDALGYKVADAHFANAIEESTDPSAADLKSLRAAIKQRRLAFFVVNTQVQSKLVDSLVKACRQAGVPVLAVTETMPKHRTYRQWMMQQYTALAKLQAKAVK